MSGRSRSPLAVVGVCLLLTWFIGTWIPGCGGPGLEDPNDTVEKLFPAKDVETVRNAAVAFDELLKTNSREAARTALVQKLLNEDENVDSAQLFEDGYSIYIEFKDGCAGIVDTTDHAALLERADEPDNGPWTQSDAVAKHADAGSPGARSPTADRRFAAKSSDGLDLQTPGSRTVKIIDAAGVTTPYCKIIAQNARQMLLDRGWDENDISLKTRTDTSVTPQDFFQLNDAGIVILIGHTYHGTSKKTGQMMYFFQCCANADFTGVDGAQAQALYEKMRDEKKLLVTTATDDATGEQGEQLVFRSDAFGENFAGNFPNSYVHLVSCSSWQYRDEFKQAGCGSFTGWDGREIWRDGCDGLLGSLFAMMHPDGAMTDAQAHAAIAEWGYGVSHPDPQPSILMQEPGEKAFYLPAWLQAEVDISTLPEETDKLVVEIAYSDDCPPETFEFSLAELEADDGTIDLGDVFPVDATMTLKALDAEDALLKTRDMLVAFECGRNEEELAFCLGDLDLMLGAYPAEGDGAVHHIDVSFDYASDELTDPAAVQVTPSDESITAWTRLEAGAGALTTTAYNAVGEIVGRSETVLSVDCGENVQDVCYGWIKVQADELPPDAERVDIQADGGAAGDLTGTFAPGEAVYLYGYDVGDTVEIDADVFGAYDSDLGSDSTTVTIVCGENLAVVRVYQYGITISADTEEIPADGTTAATVTATLRKWAEGDVLAPTGDPIPGKQVEFFTDFGDLAEPTTATSGADGKATVQLTGTANGIACVGAAVTADLVESNNRAVVAIGQVVRILPEEITINYDQIAEMTADVRPTPAEDTHIVYYWRIKSSFGHLNGGTPDAFHEFVETDQPACVYRPRGNGEAVDANRQILELTAFRVENGNRTLLGTAQAKIAVVAPTSIELPVAYFEWQGTEPAGQEQMYWINAGWTWDPMPKAVQYDIMLHTNGNDPDGVPDDGDVWVKTGDEYSDTEDYYYINYPRSKKFHIGPGWGSVQEEMQTPYDYITNRTAGWTITVKPRYE